MTWTVTQTVSLAAGDRIMIAANPEYWQGQEAGDYTTPIYLSATVSNTVSPPVVTPSGLTAGYTAGGPAGAVDPGVTVTSSDADITGASMTINNYQSGDLLNFTPIDGITIASNSGGVLTLSGSATPAQYQAALQSVTFSSTGTSTAARNISIVVDDSSASPTTSNTASETVNVAAPVTIVGAYVGLGLDRLRAKRRTNSIGIWRVRDSATQRFRPWVTLCRLEPISSFRSLGPTSIRSA